MRFVQDHSSVFKFLNIGSGGSWVGFLLKVIEDMMDTRWLNVRRDRLDAKPSNFTKPNTKTMMEKD